jgi:hypothetical protein
MARAGEQQGLTARTAQNLSKPVRSRMRADSMDLC